MNNHAWVFRHIGRKWSEDFHCWDLVKLIYNQELGIDIASDLDAIKNPLCVSETSVAIAKGLEQWVEVEGQPKEFDVCLMGRQNVFHHIGVAINNKTIFHVTNGHLSAAAHIDQLKKQYKIIKFYRHAKNL